MTIVELSAVASLGVVADVPRPAGIGDLESLRRPLTGYCYRMLGSAFDAEDAVQEAFMPAWQRAPELRDPQATQAWVYRIATHVCLDALRAAKRRALPVDLSACNPPRGPRPTRA